MTPLHTAAPTLALAAAMNRSQFPVPTHARVYLLLQKKSVCEWQPTALAGGSNGRRGLFGTMVVVAVVAVTCEVRGGGGG